MKTKKWLVSAVAISLGITAAGCSNPDTPAATDQFTIIEPEELGNYNPLLGEGRNGQSKVYEGLYRLEENVTNRLPGLIPSLAASAPTSNREQTEWTVTTRKGVTFSDGTSFGPEDVVATYKALLDKRYASPLSADYDIIKDVRATSPNTVTFDLKEPYAVFPPMMMMAIAPSETFTHPMPASEMSINNKPVGTGPYKLASFRPDQAVFEANDHYWGEKPAVKKFVVRHTEDDNARAQQIKAGDAQGTDLPPLLARSLESSGYSAVSVPAADWRGVALPAGDKVAGDPVIRKALNYAVNREAMVKDILQGGGAPTSSLLGKIYGAAYDPAQDFTFDTAKAEQILDAGGWKKGADGTRAKNGQKATFDLAYYATDNIRRDLALAVISDAKKVGIVINPVVVTKKQMTTDYVAKTPFLVGGGGAPYSVDSQLYTKFHSKFAVPGVGSKWDNESDYVNKDVDRILDEARVEPNEAKRDQLYRQFQKVYHDDPAMLALVYIHHNYVIAKSSQQAYTGQNIVLEPHAHGAKWGPWYSLARWHPAK